MTSLCEKPDMATLNQIKEDMKQLSEADQMVLLDWLENLLEDRLELKDEFKAEIKAGKKDIARQIRVAKDVTNRYRNTLRKLAN